MPAGRANEIATFVREHSEVVSPAAVPIGTCRDPDDLPVLGTAPAGKAELLVTGDEDLLALERHGGVAILTPRQCYERLGSLG
jgi:uncharacterized protein